MYLTFIYLRQLSTLFRVPYVSQMLVDSHMHMYKGFRPLSSLSYIPLFNSISWAPRTVFRNIACIYIVSCFQNFRSESFESLLCMGKGLLQVDVQFAQTHVLKGHIGLLGFDHLVEYLRSFILFHRRMPRFSEIGPPAHTFECLVSNWRKCFPCQDAVVMATPHSNVKEPRQSMCLLCSSAILVLL